MLLQTSISVQLLLNQRLVVVEVVTNLPSISMEEVQPVTHTDADLLAPEEIHRKEEIKGDLEKTLTGKKQEKKKLPDRK